MISVNQAPALELAILPAFELAPIIASAVQADSGKLCDFPINTASLFYYDYLIPNSNHSILIGRNNIHYNNFYHHYISYNYQYSRYR